MPHPCINDVLNPTAIPSLITLLQGQHNNIFEKGGQTRKTSWQKVNLTNTHNIVIVYRVTCGLCNDSVTSLDNWMQKLVCPFFHHRSDHKKGYHLLKLLNMIYMVFIILCNSENNGQINPSNF